MKATGTDKIQHLQIINEHQMELVAECNGVQYINDSKSINIKSAVQSINSIQAEILLIIGGEDRMTNYEFLLHAELKKVRAVIYLGKDKERILSLLMKYDDLFAPANSIEEAIQIAKLYAKEKQVVLFSPACPSYDAFDNYKNRGNLFRETVKKNLFLTNSGGER
jgi:UDP-N-acetylmuramoylalanine--D-glutamate ligase